MDEIGKFFAENPMAGVIAAGEIGFWVCLAAGLAVRYVLRARRVSAVLLAMVPLVDAGVLVATVLDLSAGGKPGFTHGLAAVYLGFSVVFGPGLVRWADARFAYRFAGGPPPPQRQGRERARYEWREWGKCLLACGIAAVALLAAIFAIGEPARVAPLWGWFPRLGIVSVVWLFAGPVWEELFGERAQVRR
ncbi:hypothetical protein AB0J55_41245 [Amycolatopsis sp. NPDC049688]|uniref:hypothetical protein n=1 Tax=Amycolatopsis sp. NPDC049688 TaxID=3154733 RepID=UPI00343DEB84